MLKNYWLIAIRRLARQRVHSLINILGLTVGIASCLIIYLITHFELGYDTFHPAGDRIYRVTADQKSNDGDTRGLGYVVSPLPQALRKELTGCQAVSGFYDYDAKVTIPAQRIGGILQPARHFDKPENGTPSPIIVAEPQYFDIFQYRWLSGNAASSLNEPFKIILSQSEVQHYFGNISPDQAIGKKVDFNDSLHLTVSGVVEDWHHNTDFGFKDFISFATVQASFLKRNIDLTAWYMWDYYSQGLVRLAPGTTVAQVERQLPAIVNKYMHPGKGESLVLRLQPLRDIHFNAAYPDGFSRKAHLPTLYALMGIAVFILLLAAINFVNLSTAQSLQRAKEIGIRKVLGSRRKDITFQFLGETLVLATLATGLSLLITPPALRLLQVYIPDGVRLDLTDPAILLFLAGITLVTALLAGFYPARIISALLPVLSLKGQAASQLEPNRYLRKGLIVFQFTISLVFIMGVLIVTRQMHYVLNKDLGFNTDAILTLRTSGQYPPRDREVLAQEIRELPGVAMVTRHNQTPIASHHGGTVLIYHGPEDRQIDASFDAGDQYDVPLFGLRLVAGRNLEPTDTLRDILLNETAARQLGFDRPADAVGATLETGFGDAKGTVVGILKDFNSQSLHDPIEPYFMISMRRLQRTISLKLAPQNRTSEDVSALLTKIQQLWRKTYPNEKFVYTFLDDNIALLYEKERKTSGLLQLAMYIAITISCMGLLGLATFAAQQRAKEIGIRKVLGATVADIVGLLSTHFLWPVALAILLATPVAWYFMNGWLNDFAFRTTMPWWIFALAGIAAIAIALVTVGIQALRAALANPVGSLRSE